MWTAAPSSCTCTPHPTHHTHVCTVLVCAHPCPCKHPCTITYTTAHKLCSNTELCFVQQLQRLLCPRVLHVCDVAHGGTSCHRGPVDRPVAADAGSARRKPQLGCGSPMIGLRLIRKTSRSRGAPKLGRLCGAAQQYGSASVRDRRGAALAGQTVLAGPWRMAHAPHGPVRTRRRSPDASLQQFFTGKLPHAVPPTPRIWHPPDSM